MSLLEDASLLSFYFISQSSQKIPSQERMEDQQTIMSHSKKQIRTTLGSELISDNTDFNLKGEDNPKGSKKYLY
ncbi:MAG: hypothetical protein ACMUIU_12695 [bacterium]